MKLPSIALDLDGVVCAFFERLIQVYNSRYSDKLSLSSFNDYAFERCLSPEVVEKVITIFNEPGFFVSLEVLPYAIETIREFTARQYDFKICTAPARNLNKKINGNSSAEKFEWLETWLPEQCNSAIVTASKEYVATNLLVDDSPMNIIAWCARNQNGIGYLVDQPWNQMFTDYPLNCVRGAVQDVCGFIDDHWCPKNGEFKIPEEELCKWQRNMNTSHP